MRFSPDGAHLLGGIGAGNVYLDGAPIVAHAGGWDWMDAGLVEGPGGYDGASPGFYAWPLPAGPLRYENALAATNFYANGLGSWLRYLADRRTHQRHLADLWRRRARGSFDGRTDLPPRPPRSARTPTGSTDSAGNSWPDRVALGFDGYFEIFTDAVTWQPLIFRDITTQKETTEPNPGEWTELPDHSGFFSRNFRGAMFGGEWYACGYRADVGGLAVWRPFNASAPVWRLSTTPDDFNPDIAHRMIDGRLVVGSGVNQGETGQHLYELDPYVLQWRKDGGPWQPLTPAGPTPPDPEPPEPVEPVTIAPFHHYPYEGPYFATGQYGATDHPGNCEVLVRAAFAEMVRARPVFADLESAPSVPDEWLRGVMTSAIEGGSTDATIDEAIAYAASRRVPVLIYSDTDDYPQWIVDRWLKDAAGVPIPNRIPHMRGYPAAKKQGEPLKATPAEDVARIRATAEQLRAQFGRVAMARTMYTQSGNYPLDHVLAMQPGLTDLVRDLELFADLWFAWLRDPANSIAGNPELQAWCDALPAACVGAPPPVLEEAPGPEPPEPEPPEPEPPEPEPPEPEPPEPEPPPTPVDCVTSAWGPWSAWSAWASPIGSGFEVRHRTRTRSIVTAPAHGGKPCGPLTDTEREIRQVRSLVVLTSFFQEYNNMAEKSGTPKAAPFTVARLLAGAQFNDQGNNKITVTIANPLKASYLGLPPAGTQLGGWHDEQHQQPITGDDCVLSIQPDGTPEVRKAGTNGGYETAEKQSGLAIFKPCDGCAYGIPYAD